MDSCLWHRNIRTFIVAVCLVMFFYAVTGIVKRLSNNSDSYSVYFGMLTVALVLLTLNGADGIGELLGQSPMPVGSTVAGSF